MTTMSGIAMGRLERSSVVDQPKDMTELVRPDVSLRGCTRVVLQGADQAARAAGAQLLLKQDDEPLSPRQPEHGAGVILRDVTLDAYGASPATTSSSKRSERSGCR